MIKVLIADDHAVVRKGLKQILSDWPDMGELGEAQNADEVFDLVKRERWDIAILDIGMPGRGGLETLKDLKRLCPKLPVLVLSVYPEDQYGIRALRAGAAGYMTKESAPEELVKAIRKALAGGKYVSNSLAEKLARELATDAEVPLHQSLSDREYQVLCLIASGKAVGEIAEELSLSIKTISTYRVRILEKMHLKTNSEITRYAIENRLV
ncbi:MAG TPA: response regulator transcription factor [Acidobacteriota bacterium]|jgi:DNA-binding NarL/FixJ family response regulator